MTTETYIFQCWLVHIAVRVSFSYLLNYSNNTNRGHLKINQYKINIETHKAELPVEPRGGHGFASSALNWHPPSMRFKTIKT